jgi:hypothetical protein
MPGLLTLRLETTASIAIGYETGKGTASWPMGQKKPPSAGL